MKFHVYNPAGERVAECAFVEDAAAIISSYGDGAEIRVARVLVWAEGHETQEAGESYDYVATTVHRRLGGGS